MVNQQFDYIRMCITQYSSVKKNDERKIDISWFFQNVVLLDVNKNYVYKALDYRFIMMYYTSFEYYIE